MKVNSTSSGSIRSSDRGPSPLEPELVARGQNGEPGLSSEAHVLLSKWGWVFLLLAVGLAHGMALRADFYLDDQDHILMRETGKVADGMDYRFRFVTGRAWDGIYALFGASSAAFHAFNLILHAAVTLSLFHVARRAFALSPGWRREDGRAIVPAFAGSLIFATHPLLTEGVNYAQNASLQLVTLFTLGAVGSSLAFFGSGNWRHFLAVIGFLALATFSKEVGLIYAGLSVGLTWLVFGREKLTLPGLGRSQSRRYVIVTGMCLFLCFCWYAVAILLRVSKAPLWGANFFTQGRLFWSYVRRMAWPTDLCADHLVPFSGVGFEDPWAVLGVVGAGLVVAAVTVGLWSARGRVPCFLLLLGLIPLLMRFVYINKELFVEYRVYPAFPWIAAAVGLGIGRAFSRMPRLTACLLAVAVGGYVMASSRRSMVWSDAYQVALDNIRQYPDHLRARTHLQRIDMLEGDWERVKEVRHEAQSALGRILAFNREAPWGRKYELSMAYRAYMGCEHFYAIALTETEGSKKALDHTGKVLMELDAAFPGVLKPESEFHEIALQIVEIDGILKKHGQEYDQRRRSQEGAASGNVVN